MLLGILIFLLDMVGVLLFKGFNLYALFLMNMRYFYLTPTFIIEPKNAAFAVLFS